MNSFVVLAARRYQERACTDLSAQFRFIKRRDALWVPSEMLGMWIGPGPDIVSASRLDADGAVSDSRQLALDIRSEVGVSGWWMMFQVKDSSLTRVRLLDELVARSVAPEGDRQPRFVPVFLRSTPDDVCRSELAQLCERHPDEVCPPLQMNPMTGALCPLMAPAGSRTGVP